MLRIENKEKCQDEKEIVASKLNDYIYDDTIRSYPTKILYDILKMYFQKEHTDEENNEIIDFMFTILNERKSEASVLFSLVKFGENQIDYIKLLINNYKNNFNFYFINESLCEYAVRQNEEINELKSINKDLNKFKAELINKIDETNEGYTLSKGTLEKENKKLKKNINKLIEKKKNNEDSITKLNKDIMLLKKQLSIVNNKGKDKFVTYKDDNLISYNLYENTFTAEVIESPNASGNVIIPNSIFFGNREYKITKICRNAFNNSSIVNLSLPQNLKELDDLWCHGADKLVKVEINQENSTFSNEEGFLIYKGGNGIKEIVFASRNFEGSFTVPNDVTRIRDYSFANLNKLSTLKLSSNINAKIDSNAFYKCIGLIAISFSEVKEVTLCQYAFNDCINLEKLSIKNAENIKIETNCFNKLCKFKSIDISSNSIVLDNNFIFECNKFSSISIYSTNDSSLDFLNAIKKIKLNDFKLNLPKLPLDCFGNCRSITLICDKDFAIDNNTFRELTELHKLSIETNNKLTISKESMNSYLSLEEVRFKGSLVDIGDSCFKDCNYLKKFIIDDSESVKFGENLFQNCFQLDEIAIKSTKINFGKSCFIGAINLRTFTIQEGKTINITDDCFKTCTHLMDLYILKAGTINIDKNSYSNCKELKNIIINSGSTINLGENCFSGSTVLDSVNINGNYVKIENDAFKNCISFKNFIINSKNSFTINEKIFNSNCKIENMEFSFEELNTDTNFFRSINIQNLTFKGKNITIGKNIFFNNKSLKSFHVIGGIKVKLGMKAFEYCMNLQKVEIEASSTLIIEERCFNGDNNLTTLLINQQSAANRDFYMTIGESCFSNCSFSSLMINCGEKVILYKNAFKNCKELETLTFSIENEFTAYEFCFSSCEKLKTVTIASENTIFKDFCFEYCSSLAYISCLKAKKIIITETAFKVSKTITRYEDVLQYSINTGVQIEESKIQNGFLRKYLGGFNLV